MTSSVEYTGELRTVCVHLKSNNQIITDAPTDNNGKGETFSPTDMVATALASCMLTIMGIKADSLKVCIKGTTAQVKKIMASNPRRIQEVNISIEFPENDWSEELKNSLQRAALNCPVAKSLSSDLKQTVTFTF